MNRSIPQKLQWMVGCILFFSLWAMPASMKATYVDEIYHYSIQYYPRETIKLTLALYDCDGADCWVKDGYVYVEIVGEANSKKTLVHYKAESDISNSRLYNKAKFSTGVTGRLQVIRDIDHGNEVVTQSEKTISIYRPNTKQEYFSVEMEWIIPNELRDKTLKFSFSIRRDGNSRYEENVEGLESKEWKIDKMDALVIPEMMTPMLSYEKANAGQLMVPWMVATGNIHKVTLNYKDKDGNEHAEPLDSASSGFIYFPMESIMRDCNLIVNYSDTENKPRESKSALIDFPILHTAKKLNAALQPDGTALLTWTVDRPGYNDVMDNDIWEIQRCIGDDANENKWQSIGQVIYDNDTTAFSYTDEMLFSSYESDSIHYRVRRASTAVWDWSEVAGIAKDVVSERFFLPYVGQATVTKAADWGVNDQHNVNIEWDMRTTPLQPYDFDGRFIIRSKEDWCEFANLVNSGQTRLAAVMNADVNLGNLQDMVGTPTNPYRGDFDGNGHTLTVNYTFNINENVADKDDNNHPIAPFANVGKNVVIHHFRTAGSVTTNAKYAAGIVGRVVTDSDKDYDQVLTLSQCHSSVSINSTYRGPGCHGGLVGHVTNNKIVSIVVSDCLFDGEFIGKNTYGWGGFIGYIMSGDFLAKRCLFDPKTVDINGGDCGTFYRRNRGSNSIADLYWTKDINSNGRTTMGNNASNMSADELVQKLGDQWKKENNKAVVALTSIPDIQGATQYTKAGRFVLRSAKDWQTFCDLVNGGQTKLNAILAENIDLGEVQSHVGVFGKVTYEGDFDGFGHTLTYAFVETDSKSEACAPFEDIGNGCRIHDLHVKGTINTVGLRPASVFAIAREGKSILENIVSDVALTASNPDYSTANVELAGIGGATYTNSELTVTDCAFYGSLTHTGNRARISTSGILSEMHTYAKGEFKHVLFSPSSVQLNETDYRTRVFVGGLNPDNVTLDMCLYTSTGGLTPDGNAMDASTFVPQAIVLTMGDKWSVIDGRAVPTSAVKNSGDDAGANIAIWDDRAKMVVRTEMRNKAGEVVHTAQRELTTDEIKQHKLTLSLNNTCVDYDFYLTMDRNQSPLYVGMRSRQNQFNTVVMKTEQGEDSNYEFNLNGKVTELSATERQASVLLKWTTNNLLVDYFRILRIEKIGDVLKVDTLSHNYQQTQFTDDTPQPQHAYTYRVEAIVSCEGEQMSFVEAEGHCASTGMVCGYARLADGTAVAGATVVATPAESSHIIDGKEGTAVTDESGYFEIPGLIYQSKGSYTITITMPGSSGTFDPQTVEFTDHKNLFNNLTFYMSDYFTYSGTVMYSGSSIPVLGAEFLLDGRTITKSSGPDKGKPVTTNSAGEFKLSIPKGPHTVQVVKKGHVFENKGFLINHDALPGTDSTRIDFQHNIYDEYLWDLTRVTLRGRVVGGVDQGNKPLGHSLSTNNLGDSIRIVVQLEGDNSSWIVRDQFDETIRVRDSLYAHGVSDTTRVVSNRHTITISPDNKSGEYQVPFLPVKYKVTDIYCNGYATLFQAGKVGETLDLSDYVQGDTVTYNRIYHRPATLAYEQFTGSNEKYYGLKEYKAQDNLGKDVLVPLWCNGKYSLGYPVFMAGSPTLLVLSAREEYYYNNVVKDQPDDIVLLSGGTVYLHNGLVSAEDTDSVKLDEEGKATYLFTPKNLTFTQEGDDALKSLTFTLLYDDTYYDIKPLKAYVMAYQTKAQGNRMVVAGTPHLVDILRDPPGSSSSSYIESSSKLKYGYKYDIKIEGGFNIELSQGKGSNYYQGLWAGEGSGSEAGNLNSSKTNTLMNIGLIISYFGAWNYSYEFETTEKIQTSSSVKAIGADADLYIGMVDETVLEDAIAVRVVPESMYKLLVPATGNTYTLGGKAFKLGVPTVKVLAEGTDTAGNKVYLIRDEVLRASPRFNSTFVYSKQYIENELLPQLLRLRQSMMLPKGTTAEEAKAHATSLKHPVYVSKVGIDDPQYALTDDKGERTYIQYVPDGSTQDWPDSIMSLNNEMMAWIAFMTNNEKEKLMVSESDKVKTYSFDGNSKLDYSEKFNYAIERENYMLIPIVSNPVHLLGGTFFDNLVKDFNKKGDGTNEPKEKKNDQGKTTEVEFSALGTKMSLKFKPVINFDFNYKNSSSENHSKKTGFTLACDRQSNLTVDVYRSKVDVDDYATKIKEGDMDVIYKYNEETKDAIRAGATGTNQGLSFMPSDAKSYSNFIFRTRAGATKKPYEDARYTQYYNAGLLLDAKTIPIDNVKIWCDQATVSNVPYDEPAKFLIHLANESELPTQVTPFLRLCRMDNDENGKGAKIFVDGVPLTPDGIPVSLGANNVVDKLVEVHAGQSFDYEDLTLFIWDPDDSNRKWKQNLTAHFLPSAGKINIALPDDKWVLNTESPYNKDKGLYYMPVRIDGFDVNTRGFDHIELQYKLSTEGDKSWVNTCSYYKSDSLMALASGERKLIKNDGYIDDAIFYGEKDPVEQYYDLRAVVYCRHAGGYITSVSKVISGVKDTRIPMPFGTPKPVNGILDIGDDIIISFSEPIAGNYLTKVNNFEVMGTTNSSNISLSTALRFSGYSYANTKAERHLGGKSFSFDLMLNPDHNGKEMYVLCHGNSNNHLALGLTADRRLTATIEGQTAVSDKPVEFMGLHQVVYSFELTEDMKTIVRFFDGSMPIGEKELDVIYKGYGGVFLGANIFSDQGTDETEETNLGAYEGTMLEMRLWNTAMTPDIISKYSQKVLTGYELNLVDNYALNEGYGDYSYDKTVGGNDLTLSGTSWVVPNGISLKLDGEKGVKLASKYFNRQNYEDYTLMFWFATTDDYGTLIANGLGEDEPNNGMHFNIGLDDGNVFFHSSGKKVKTNSTYSDGAWHHFAMTISRSRNVGNIYIDQKLKATFPTDSLGGINGNDLALGATYVDPETVIRPLKGYIDEIAMYEMVLPRNLIDTYSKATPSGKEMGTMVYLPFSRSEVLGDNQTRLMPTGISLRRYKDGNSFSENRCDTIIPSDVVLAMADRENYARMRENTLLENLAFSYVVDGQDMLLNIDVPDADIEKTNVYITVKEVADLNGNLTASPVQLNLFVYRNPLRWQQKHLNIYTEYGEGTTVDVVLKNLDGKKQSYSMTGLPLWITASKTAGVIDALDEETITLTISPYINIGDYDENIYVVGENGMAEPLPVNITVRGEDPRWMVSDALKERNITMNMVARIVIDDYISSDPNDIVAVFGDSHQLLGVTHVDVDQTADANEALAYLTIYNKEDVPTQLHFEFFNASTGKIHVLIPNEDLYPDGILFKANEILGTSDDPVILYESYEEVQTIQLKRGWNWLSFYVLPEEQTVSELLYDGAVWEVGDGFEVISSKGKPYLYSYKSKPSDDPNQRIYFWDHGDDMIVIDPMLMYRFYSKSDKTAYLTGQFWWNQITVKNGWNRIGYISSINLPLAIALADYTDFASKGDIIKSQDEFAVLNTIGENKVWKGSLKFMKSGMGYMLKRNAKDERTFTYPVYDSSSRYSRDINTRAAAPLFTSNAATNMSVIAVAEGVDLQAGDKLVAYHGADICGIAQADEDGLFFLTVAEAENSAADDVQFTIERDGETVAFTPQTMRYTPDAVSGSLDEPTVIRFIESDRFTDGQWYNLQGIRLPGRPTDKGVYIFNGNKVLIK